MECRHTPTPSIRTALTGLALAGCLIAGANAEASTITLDTRYYSGGSLASATAYKSTIDALDARAATSGYGSVALSSFNAVSNHGLFGSSTNIAFRYEVDFNAAKAGNWSFRIGPDFGLGGAVFLDGTLEGFRTSDMWWAGSYGSASQNFSFTANLASGNHKLLIYGLEACCDGNQQAQYRAPGSAGYTSFSSQDGLNPVADKVPEPGSLPLLAVAGLGMFGLSRKSSRWMRQPGF